MKNLFEYATKELSQDAFLRWLFENYNCENKKVREACCFVLSKLCKKEFKDGDITNLITHAQWWKIDVIVEFEAKGQEYVAAIEDKTSSPEHHQLGNYGRKLDDYKPYDKKMKNRIFYKTDLKEYCKNDIEACESDKWDYYFLEEIEQWFSLFANSGCLILDNYIEHLSKLKEELSKISDKPIKEWNINNFYTFFEKKIIHNSELRMDENFIDIERWGWYGSYASIGVNRKFENERKHFTLEVVARPYYDNHNRFDVIIRFNNKDGSSASEKDAIKDYLSQKLSDCNIDLVIRNHKMCIASNSQTNKKSIGKNPLSYGNNVNDLANTITYLFKWFYKISNIDYDNILAKYNNLNR